MGSKTRRLVEPEVPEVIEANVVGPYSLELLFSDGLRKCVNLESELYGEVFEPLRDPAYFAQMRVDPVAGTVVWPNGADFAPEFLYDWAPEGERGAETEAADGSMDRSGEPLMYLVVFEKSDRGYSAFVPDLPGCVATGVTPEEARQRIREAIALHAESLEKHGQPMPEARAWAESVEV